MVHIESQSELPCKALTHADVCAVMVTYNPDLSLKQNVEALLPQVGKVIIVDNASSPAEQRLIAHVASVFKVEVIWNEKNQGIAMGLNKGIDLALSGGQYSWIATFDQDSRVQPTYLATMFEAYATCPFRDGVALIGANYALGTYEYHDEPIVASNKPAFLEVKTLMTSGTLVKSCVFPKCGQFDESLFMDYVDHEFCLRLRQHGFRAIQARHAVLVHRLGSPTSHHILGKRFMVSNYSPSRHYSNARNRLLVYHRYLTSETLWVLQDVGKWLKETMKMVLVESNRAEKLVSIAQGVRDAIKELLLSRAHR